MSLSQFVLILLLFNFLSNLVLLFVSVNKKSSKVFIKFFFLPILLCTWLALTIQQLSEVAYLSTRQVLGNVLLSFWVLASLSLNKPLKIALLSDYLNKIKKSIAFCVNHFKPDFVFHLAAQSLIKKSYEDPVKTWKTNLIGTVNLLESIRNLKKCTAVIITSDKCYKNLEINRGYIEQDILAGEDPYSASKSAAEIAIQSYVKSFLIDKKRFRIASVRAGNVIGGGDWNKSRIIPDCINSIYKRKNRFK